MQLVTPRDVSSNSTRLSVTLWTMLGYQWSAWDIKRYMKAEAKKLRPNGWYYFARMLPISSRKPGEKIELFFGLTTLALAFMMGLCVLATIMCAATFSFAAALVSFICAMGCFASAFVLILFASQGLIVRDPGCWQTVAFDPANHEHTHPRALYLVNTLRCMIPGATFRISLLYQNKELFDPVLWIRPDAESKDIPILVWDKNGNIVEPPKS